MNIGIFCSAAEVGEDYVKAARDLARLVAEGGHTLVWGGSDRGLMHEIADSAKEAGGTLFGVSMHQLKTSAFQGADTMLFAEDLAERKALILENSDVVVTLVGGTGTLDEFTDLLENRRYGRHNKQLIILNTNNFYEGLRLQYDRMQTEGFLSRLPRPLGELLSFASTPEEVMELIADGPEDIPLEQLAYSGEAV
jgi:uncharacterized protein (TIGR00730 family)